jgi:hypothetical protein
VYLHVTLQDYVIEKNTTVHSLRLYAAETWFGSEGLREPMCKPRLRAKARQACNPSRVKEPKILAREFLSLMMRTKKNRCFREAHHMLLMREEWSKDGPTLGSMCKETHLVFVRWRQ